MHIKTYFFSSDFKTNVFPGQPISLALGTYYLPVYKHVQVYTKILDLTSSYAEKYSYYNYLPTAEAKIINSTVDCSLLLVTRVAVICSG